MNTGMLELFCDKCGVLYACKNRVRLIEESKLHEHPTKIQISFTL